MIPIKTIPVRTWQFFAALKKAIGKEFLVNFYSVSPRHIDRWSCDPDFSDSSRRNPVDRYEALLEKLMELGKDDIARGVVSRQAKIVECFLVAQIDDVPDKPSLPEEMLDDYPALALLHKSMQDGEDELVVREMLERVILELRETYVSYVRHRTKDNHNKFK